MASFFETSLQEAVDAIKAIKAAAQDRGVEINVCRAPNVGVLNPLMFQIVCLSRWGVLSQRVFTS